MKKLTLFVLVVGLAAGCKKSEKKTEAPPAGSASAATTEAPKPTDKPADPGSATTDKPADPGMKPPDTAGGPRPASVTDAHVALADKMVTLMTEFGDAMKTAGTDCKAATAAAKAIGPKMAPIMEEAEKMKETTDKDPAAKEWFDKTYGPKIMGAMGPMMTTAQACSNDKDFMAAMEALPMGGKKKKADPPKTK